jgi:hypothetical protein
MKDVRSLVRDFVNDESVRERKPFTEDERREIAAEEQRKKTASTQTTNAPGPVTRPSVPTSPYVNPPVKEQERKPLVEERDTEDQLSCAHLWEWRNGVKSCKWCEKKAPVDRRDATTSWRAKVYGKK